VPAIRLIAFLGNPGPGYAGNRHNAGRLLAEALPFYASLGWQKKFKGLYCACDCAKIFSAADTRSFETAENPEKFHFLMPETYMNLSGESIQAAAQFFKIKLEEILVVHDELELPPGTLSLKFGGGLGGHNGLRSIRASFGSADCWRLRVGIGRPAGREPGAGGPPGSGGDVFGWVLSDFSAPERELLAPVFEAGAALLVRALAESPEKLLPEWAKKKISIQGV
jgi:PTH1 family peptidyl-tRNA hydrolase